MKGQKLDAERQVKTDAELFDGAVDSRRDGGEGAKDQPAKGV